MTDSVFTGCIPALMTPCVERDGARVPDFDALVEKGRELVDAGMSGVVYCGSMGDWPLLTDAERQEGVARLVQAGLRVIVGTGAVNTRSAVSHARHAAEVGAAGLMVIPRVLSRGTSPEAQKAHFEAILAAAPALPAVIYNSPYYGFETRAPLFNALRANHKNLVGFKEFGGGPALSYAAEHITAGDADLTLMVGVDTQVVHGFLNCGATGAITGIGNALPGPVLKLIELCQAAQGGDPTARRRAIELGEALTVLSTYDEGPDLVLYYKFFLELLGDDRYRLHFNQTDALSPTQRAFATAQFQQFCAWYEAWSA
jgi:dihydrodipicolinate synthase/N-acetylneuraminate lyase